MELEIKRLLFHNFPSIEIIGLIGLNLENPRSHFCIFMLESTSASAGNCYWTCLFRVHALWRQFQVHALGIKSHFL